MMTCIRNEGIWETEINYREEDELEAVHFCTDDIDLRIMNPT